MLRRMENGVVMGETSLFTKGRRLFAHGADIMLPIGRVLQELLGDGENVSIVETVRFLEVCTHDLGVFASTEEELLPSGDAEPVLTMRCKTKKGKTVHITAHSTGKPIAHHSSHGIMLEEIDSVLDDPVGLNGSECLMEMSALNTTRFCSLNPYFYLHIVIEIISVATLRLKKHNLLHDSKLLLTGIDHIVLPRRDDIAEGVTLRIKIRSDREKTTRSGAVITPIEFSYYNKQRKIKPYATPYLAHSPDGRFEHLERRESRRTTSSAPPFPPTRSCELTSGRVVCLA